MLQVWDTAGQERFRTITTGKIFNREWFSSTPSATFTCHFCIIVLSYEKDIILPKEIKLFSFLGMYK